MTHPESHSSSLVNVSKAVGNSLFSILVSAVVGLIPFGCWYLPRRDISQANLEGVHMISRPKWVSVKTISGRLLSLRLAYLCSIVMSLLVINITCVIYLVQM